MTVVKAVEADNGKMFRAYHLRDDDGKEKYRVVFGFWYNRDPIEVDATAMTFKEFLEANDLYDYVDDQL